MGELHDTVTALLDTFASAISFVRAQASRRKKLQQPVDPAVQEAETRVRKTLRKSRSDVNEAYKRDLARYGPRFASGDAEAHSSLSSILKKLTSTFLSIMERVLKGTSTEKEYYTIMSMSNSSRLQAIETFDQLSKRLPQSSLSLTPSNKSSQKHAHYSQKRKPKHASSPNDTHNPRSKSASSLIPTAALDQPRPKHSSRKKKSPDSSKSSTTSRRPHHSDPDAHRSNPSRKPTGPSRSAPPPGRDARSGSRSDRRRTPKSFTSDSTKLGEIPEHKWARDSNSLRVAYPLYSYPEPQKQRSRFMRFFGK